MTQLGNAMVRLTSAALLTVIGCAATAGAVVIGGGGSKKTDCLAVFDAPVNSPASNPRNVSCEDGAACDEDGTINGICQVSLMVCANATLPECSYVGVDSIVVDHAEDNGDPKFDPEFQALQTKIDNEIAPPTTDAVCTGNSTFRVAIKGPLAHNACRRNAKRVRLTTESDVIGGRVYRDSDSIKITCLPSTQEGGCDPQVLFTSTFDRIQTQIFNQSCALSSCHDSQTQKGDLLLEIGASHANLVNQDPANPAAFAFGWKRVVPNDPANSYIHHKLSGDLPTSAFGERMPFGRPKLPGVLRDLIEVWIQNGAPDESGGWIPGTF